MLPKSGGGACCCCCWRGVVGVVADASVRGVADHGFGNGSLFSVPCKQKQKMSRSKINSSVNLLI